MTTPQDKCPVYIEQRGKGLMELVDFEGNIKETGFYSFGNITRWARENNCIIMQKPSEEDSK